MKMASRAASIVRDTMASGYSNIDISGSRAGADQTIEQSKRSFEQYHFSSCSTQILAITQQPSKVFTTIVETMNGRVKGGRAWRRYV